MGGNIQLEVEMRSMEAVLEEEEVSSDEDDDNEWNRRPMAIPMPIKVRKLRYSSSSSDDDEGDGSLPSECFESFLTNPELIQRIEKLLCCFHCKQIPIPAYYLICAGCGAFQCGNCAFARERKISGGESLPISTCCRRENLSKGSELFLSSLINNSIWDCENKSRGCEEEVKGFDWAYHVKSCPHKYFYRCYYPYCAFKDLRKERIVTHLSVDHYGQTMQFRGAGVTLRVGYDASNENTRHVGIMMKDGCFFIFGSEGANGMMHMWVWDIQSGGRSGKYYLKLTPLGGPNDGEIRYTGNCAPYEQHSTHIISEGNCLTMTLAQLRKKHLVKQKNDMYWEVSIQVKNS